jgi:hypothetical protein
MAFPSEEPRLPEGPSNIEIAHHMSDAAHEESERERRVERLIEIGEAILLAVVAIGTAWSGYQAAKWDGRSAQRYGQSSKLRVTADAVGTRGGQEQLFDAMTFDSWLQATLTGEQRLAALYRKRFRPEYRPAFGAWLATDPFSNPNAPAGPIFMPQYHNRRLEQAARLRAEASDHFDEGVDARDTGDDYVRTTVLIATVLFLIAVSQRFRILRVRMALLGVALVLLVIAAYTIVTYPHLA